MPPSRKIDKVDLFLLTEPDKFSYKGSCKADISLGPKQLVVHQNDKNKTTIEIPFYYPFVRHKNLLCHISPTKLHDIVLVFSTSAVCKDVHDILIKYQVKINNNEVGDSNKSDELQERILVPLSNEAINNPKVIKTTRETVLAMLKPADPLVNMKEIVVKSELSEPPTEPLFEPRCSPIMLQMPQPDEPDVEVLSQRSRKRKNRSKNSTTALDTVAGNKKCKIEIPDETPTTEAGVSSTGNSAPLTKRFLDSTEYEIQAFNKRSIKKQKLIVYCSADKKMCYSYYFESKGKRFVCDKCKEKNRYVVAHLRDGENGAKFVELGLLQHMCTPLPYTRPLEAFDVFSNINISNIANSLPATSIFGSNNLMHNNRSTSANGNAAREASVPGDGSMNTNNIDGFSNTARHIKNETPEVSNNVINERATATNDLIGVNQTARILRPPDYQIYKNGESKQRLIVFYPDNRNFCFPYSYDVANNRYVCLRCRRNKRVVDARIYHDSNGDEFIELGPMNHLCPPLSYNLSSTSNNFEYSPDSPSSSGMPNENSGNSTPSLPSPENPVEGEGDVQLTNFDEPTSSKMELEESELSSALSTVNTTKFELQIITKNHKCQPRLLVFPYTDNHLCYYYYYDRTNDYFICGKCRKRLQYVIARLQKDKNGQDFVKLDDNPHICLPMPYQSVNEATDINGLDVYQIEEEKRRKLQKKTKTGKDLVVKKKESVEIVEAKDFKSEMSENIPAADAFNDEENYELACDESDKSEGEDDYTENEEDDVEESPTFEPKQTLDSSQFECQKFTKNGQQKMKLITFLSPDKKYCHMYYHDVHNNRFVCSKCRKKQHHVHAHLRELSDNETVVELGLRDHICKPVLYTPPPKEKKETFLKPDEYELTYTREGRLRPIIFASKDKNFCYEYCPNQNGIYICRGCGHKPGAASINVVEEQNLYKVSLRNAKHICKPRRYMPDKNNEKVLMAGKFKFYREKNGDGELKLITFPYDGNTEKCHIYEYSEADKLFQCINCQLLDGETIAKLFVNINNEEYILDRAPSEHLCTPVIYSQFDENSVQFLSSSGLGVKKLKSKTWNESQIIKAGNFELQRNRYGTLNAMLFVFTPENRKLCYRYYYDSYTKHYICNNCREKFKIKVTAKLYDNDDGEKYLKLGSFDHRCKPVEYEAERKIIKKPDYLVFDANNIIVFPSSNLEECYHFCSKKLHCNPCLRKRKEVSVLLLNDENGEQCLQLSRNEHVCEPQKIENVAHKIGVEVEDILAKIV